YTQQFVSGVGCGEEADRKQKTENRKQKTENRKQKTENRKQKTENRKQKKACLTTGFLLIPIFAD
ncbi:hypothetical protein, partial [Neisseria gonorrhoeae]|uniref:hypothetical protein n=1 Tax=Neisseria gonorrhoeae TaxID=485 RepID=UPI000B07ED5D